MSDLRQSVTPSQHAVLDLLDTRTPQWQMMAIGDIEGLIERELDGEIRPQGPDTMRLAALAMHLAERRHAKAHTGTGAITNLAALGLCNVWIDGDDSGHSIDATGMAGITEALEELQADKITPVLALETYTRGDDLHAVLVPTAFDPEGHPTDHQLQFHPTHASALRARLAAAGEDHANG